VKAVAGTAGGPARRWCAAASCRARNSCGAPRCGRDARGPGWEAYAPSRLTGVNGCFKHLFIVPPVAKVFPADTRARVLEAAAALFAAHGFHATTARDIAERAGVNLASAHYHFGSKEDLYLEVLRVQFDDVNRVLEQRGARLTAGKPTRRADLEALLRARIAVMMEMLLGPPPGLHGTLMLRELGDPSAALPHIVQRFIEPMKRETAALVALLEPTLSRAAVERGVMSIVGQVMSIRAQLPALPYLLAAQRLDRAGLAQLAEHIATFSLGGLRALASAPRPKAGARPKKVLPSQGAAR